jgi:type I restriction enzyme S subunit
VIAARLKLSVLQAAVRGKLAHQDIRDEPAVILLERIDAARTGRYNCGTSKGSIRSSRIVRIHDGSPTAEDGISCRFVEKNDRGDEPDVTGEIPFGVPPSWEWARLESLGMILGGHTPRRDNPDFWHGDIPWLTSSDMNEVSGKFIYSGKEYITERGMKVYQKSMIPEGSIVYCAVQGIGRIAIAGNPLCTSNQLRSIAPYVSGIVPYLYYCLIERTPHIRSMARGEIHPNINSGVLGQTLVPIPPLAEQKRIVARLDRILPLIDDYAAMEAEMTDIESRFSVSLRESFLQTAVHGKLTAQETDDDPARFLLDHLRRSRRNIVATSRFIADTSRIVRAANHVGRLPDERCRFLEDVPGRPAVDVTDDLPFEIPGTWEWARLSTLGQIIKGSCRATENPDNFIDGNIPFISAFDIRRNPGMLVSGGERMITERAVKRAPLRIVPADSVVFSSLPESQCTAVTANPLCINNNLFAIIPYDTVITEYLYFVLLQRTREIFSRATGSAMKTITLQNFKLTPVPIPPLSEQRRMVLRLKRLLPLIPGTVGQST